MPGPAYLVYEPVPEDIHDPALKKLYQRWADDLAAGKPAAGEEVLTYPEAQPLLRNIMLLEILKDDPFRFDYRYRMYGAEIAHQEGQDMTGRKASEFSKDMYRFYAKVYEVAIIRKIVVHSLHPPPALDVNVLKWERLIFPLGAPEIKWLLVVAVAKGKRREEEPAAPPAAG